LSGNTNSLTSINGINHYTLSRTTCGTPAAATTPSPAASACTSWVLSLNTGVFGGVLQPAATSIPACQNACINNVTCVAIDFDSSNACYFILSAASNNKVSRSGITHYDLTVSSGCSPASTVTPSPSAPSCFTWTQSDNTGVFGGSPQPTATTIAACQAACISNRTCVAIDFDPLVVISS
jgi:hypothetical protein